MTLIEDLREIVGKELKTNEDEVKKKLIKCPIFKVQDGKIVKLKNKLSPQIKPVCENLELMVDEIASEITNYFLLRSFEPIKFQKSFSEMLDTLGLYMGFAARYGLIAKKKGKHIYKTICNMEGKLKEKLSEKGSQEFIDLQNKPRNKRELVKVLLSIFKKRSTHLSSNSIYYNIAHILKHFKIEEGKINQIYERVKKYSIRYQAKTPA